MCTGPRGAAMRPVDHLPLARRAAEQRVHRHPQRLSLDVPKRQLDPRDRLGRDAAGRLPRQAVHVPVASLDRERIAAEQDRLHVSDRADNSVRIAPVRHLAVAGDAFGSAHCDELPGSPAGVNDEGLDFGDFHEVLHCVHESAADYRAGFDSRLPGQSQGGDDGAVLGEIPPVRQMATAGRPLQSLRDSFPPRRPARNPHFPSPPAPRGEMGPGSFGAFLVPSPRKPRTPPLLPDLLSREVLVQINAPARLRRQLQVTVHDSRSGRRSDRSSRARRRCRSP